MSLFYFILLYCIYSFVFFIFFFFNDTATTEIYTLSLHDALPISLLLAAFATEQANRGHAQQTHRRRFGNRHEGHALAARVGALLVGLRDEEVDVVHGRHRVVHRHKARGSGLDDVEASLACAHRSGVDREGGDLPFPSQARANSVSVLTSRAAQFTTDRIGTGEHVVCIGGGGAGGTPVDDAVGVQIS